MHIRKIPNALTTKAQIGAPALALPLQDNSNKLTKGYCTLYVPQNPTIPTEESCFIAICTQVELERAKNQALKSQHCIGIGSAALCALTFKASAGGNYSLNYDCRLHVLGATCSRLSFVII